MTKYRLEIDCEQKDLIGILRHIAKKGRLLTVENLENKTLFDYSIIPFGSWTYSKQYDGTVNDSNKLKYFTGMDETDNSE